MLKALLTELNKFPDKHIAIHHDFHQAPFDESLMAGLHYELVKNYTRTYWSHAANIKAINETFSILYRNNCDWYITLSAHCFPVKSVAAITQFFEQTKFDGFIEHNNVLENKFDFYKYFRKGFSTSYLFSIPFFTRKGRLTRRPVRIPRSKSAQLFSGTYIPYHGSDWFAINKKCMGYLLGQKDELSQLVQLLVQANKGPDLNICPPEIVYQTILGNNRQLVLSPDNLRYINWENSVNWHPNILVQKHFDSIINSTALFARKFDWEQSKELLASLGFPSAKTA